MENTMKTKLMPLYADLYGEKTDKQIEISQKALEYAKETFDKY